MIVFDVGCHRDIGAAVDELEMQICGFVNRSGSVGERGADCDLRESK
jgi:hypothetical protein